MNKKKKLNVSNLIKKEGSEKLLYSHASGQTTLSLSSKFNQMAY